MVVRDSMRTGDPLLLDVATVEGYLWNGGRAHVLTQGLTGAVIDVSYEWRLTSGGNTITETLVEDGVEMLTTYSDDNGELVVKHYCALGTQPVFSVSSVSDTELALALDESANDLHAEHESFVTSMKWTMQDDDSSMLFTNTIMLNGKLTENSELLTRVE